MSSQNPTHLSGSCPSEIYEYCISVEDPAEIGIDHGLRMILKSSVESRLSKYRAISDP